VNPFLQEISQNADIKSAPRTWWVAQDVLKINDLNTGSENLGAGRKPHLLGQGLHFHIQIEPQRLIELWKNFTPQITTPALTAPPLLNQEGSSAGLPSSDEEGQRDSRRGWC
jgi:hypothetical protein